MKKFLGNRKLITALLLALVMIMCFAVTAFAEGTGEGSGAKSYWDDPLFFEFIFLVVAFLSVVICSFLIYGAIKNRNKVKEYEEREGTVKLYEDLDDAKWDAPDSVYIDALEPTAAVLSELEPVKPIRGLDGFVITEQPIEPVKAMNMGADPYVFRRADDISNAVYEATPATPITLGDLDNLEPAPAAAPAPSRPTETPFIEAQKQPDYPYVYENTARSVLEDELTIPKATEAQPIEPASIPQTSPYTYIAANAPGAVPFVTPAAAFYENTYRPTVLEDTVAPVAEPAPAAPGEAVTPKSGPVSYLDVPITIFTSGDDDGVVKINATVYENKVTATELRDEPTIAPVEKAAPITPAATPASEPISYTARAEELPLLIPTTEANIFEDNTAAITLEDEIIPVVAKPIAIPAVATPVADPVADTFVNAEAPVEIPATEANIFEDTFLEISLIDEPEMPIAEMPVVIPEAVTPASDPVADTFANVEAPVEIPVTEANIFEDSVAAIALEDEPEIPVAEIPVVITAAVTPASDPVADTFADVEAPVEIPVTEANIFEDSVAAITLEDEPEIPVAEMPVVIPEAVTPASDPVADTFADVEAPVEIPVTEANIFEDSVAAIALEDEPEIPVAEIPMVITEAVTPAAEPVADTFADVETPVEIPVTEANIFEDSVAAITLEDEPEIPVAEIPVVITEAVTPASDPVADTFADVEAPVEIPVTEANVFEDSVAAITLEDEPEIPVAEIPVVITAAVTPASDPVADTFADVEAPVEIPATEANIFEDTFLEISLIDEPEIPVAEIPVVITAAVTPASDPVADTFANVEAPVEIPVTEANIFEDSVAAITLEDEPEIPVAEIPMIITEAVTPAAEPVADMFADVEAPVEIPATEANVFEDSVAAITLEDEPEIPVAEIPVVIPEAVTPASDPVADTFTNVETPVEIPVTEANVFEDSVAAITLEDEPEIPVAEIPVVITAAVTPASDPVADTFADVEAPVEIPTTEANIFEDSVVAITLEDEPEIPVAEIPVVITAAVTPASDPVADTFADVEAPVEIPTTEAAVYEQTVDAITLADEPEMPIAEIPMVITEAVTPAAEPVADMFADVETPIEIPATEAAVYEQTVDAITLADEPEMPIAEIPMVITEAVTPASDPVADTFADVEAPVEIPATEAAVYEQTVDAITLADEPEMPIAEIPMVITEAVTPAAEPVADTFADVETPVEIPVTEAAVYEQTVDAITLVDEPEMPIAEIPMVITEAVTPAAEPVADTFADVETPVEIPTTEAAVYEQTVDAITLADEPEIPVAEMPVVITEAVTPAAEPVADTFADVETPVEIPATEAAVYEQTFDAITLADEPEMPIAEIPMVISEVATPASDPVADTFADIEAPVEIPATEAAVYEQTVDTITLVDEPEIPVAEMPVVITAAVTPASDPVADTFADVEAPVEIPTTEAAVYENTVAATILEDAPAIPEAEMPVIIPAVVTPNAEPITDSFIAAETPVSIPVTEAAVYENTVAATILEDAPVIPEAEMPVIIPAVVTPNAEPITDSFIAAETPVEIPVTEAAVYENTVAATILEDAPAIPEAEMPVVIPVITTPVSEPIADSFIAAETPVSIPVTEAAVYENTVTATILEDAPAIPEAEMPVVIPAVVTPNAEPVTDSFIAAETPVSIPVTEAAVYENTVAAILLEDEAIAPATEQPAEIKDASLPAVAPIADTVAEQQPSIETPEAYTVFSSVATTPIFDTEEQEKKAEPVISAVVITDGERVVGQITEHKTAEEKQPEQIHVVETVSEDSIEDKTDSLTALIITDKAETEPTEQSSVNAPESYTVYSPVELTPLSDAEEHLKTAESTSTTVVITDGERVVGQIIEHITVVERQSEEVRPVEPVSEETADYKDAAPVAALLLADEPKEEPQEQKDEEQSPAQISTIPMDSKGEVKREQPMISTIPPIAAKGVGSNAADTPFVLPATEEGIRTMATYAPTPDEDEPSFKSALRQAGDIPVAPMIDIEAKEEPAPAPTPAPTPETPTDPDVIMADSDVEILFSGDNEPEAEEEPEVIPEPEIEEPVVEPVEEPVEEPIEEPITEEPVEEPEVIEEPEAEEEPEIIPEPEIEEPIEEPVEEEPVVEPVPMPIPEPVFTDAEHADELMTDEEAEEHIEIIEEEPGRERKGKMDFINLDTICDNFEDGEEVTLEALKAKKLIPAKMGRVKILARGTMTKKLDIIADNFSLQAVKMITLAGGRAEQYK